MKKAFILLVATLLLASLSAAQDKVGGFSLAKSIPMPGVQGSEGCVAIIHVDDAGRYREIGRLATGTNAKKSLFVPEFNSIYVAVPAQTNQPAVLKVFQAAN